MAIGNVARIDLTIGVRLIGCALSNEHLATCKMCYIIQLRFLKLGSSRRKAPLRSVSSLGDAHIMQL